MKEKTTISRSAQSSLLTFATDDEILVAGILVNLPSMIRMLESGSGFKWGRKKRRSRLDEGASLPNCAPSSSSPFLQKTDAETEERQTHSKAELEIAATATASPVTPLAFWPDEKSKLTLKSLKKRARKEYIGMVEELTQRRDLLRGEIEKMSKYYNKLRAYNSELKAVKGKVRKEEGESREKRNLGVELTKTQSQPDQKLEHPFGLITTRLNLIHVGIPDLNISVEEGFGWEQFQPLDISRDRRARFAEARRRRMDIIKSMRTASRIKFSRTRF